MRTLPTVRSRVQVLRAVEDGDARRIVAAVLEPPQPLHQDGDDVALGDGSDDSAHSVYVLNARLGAPSAEAGRRVGKCASKPRKTLILLT